MPLSYCHNSTEHGWQYDRGIAAIGFDHCLGPGLDLYVRKLGCRGEPALTGCLVVKELFLSLSQKKRYTAVMVKKIMVSARWQPPGPAGLALPLKFDRLTCRKDHRYDRYEYNIPKTRGKAPAETRLRLFFRFPRKFPVCLPTATSAESYQTILESMFVPGNAPLDSRPEFHVQVGCQPTS